MTQTAFPVHLAPAVRVFATTRGLRTHVGSRGASTGAGPFIFYGLVGGRRLPCGGSYYAGPTPQQIADTDESERPAAIEEALRAIANIHRGSVPAPAEVTPSEAALTAYPELLAVYRRQELAGVRWSDRAGRRAAKARARELADAHAVYLESRVSPDLAVEAEQVHHRWTLLHENQPQVVLDLLGAAYEDHESPAAAVGVQDDEVQLVVLVPPLSLVPGQEPSLREMGQDETSAWYRELVAGHVLVSVREALLVAPAIQSARVVAVRDEGEDADGERRARPVLATRLTRSDLQGVPWEAAGAWEIVGQHSGELLVNSSTTTGAMRPLDLTEQPELARLVEVVEFV